MSTNIADPNQDDRSRPGAPTDRADKLATLTVQEIASSYRVSESVIRYWIRNKFIPYQLVGPRGAIHIRKSDLIAMFESGGQVVGQQGQSGREGHNGTQISKGTSNSEEAEAATRADEGTGGDAADHTQGDGSGSIGEGKADPVPGGGEDKGIQQHPLPAGRAAPHAKGKGRGR